MEEIKPIKPNEQIEEKKPLLQQMKELQEKVNSKEVKKRNLRIPRKAKVRRSKLKKGYIGVLRIDENRNITAEKQRVSGFSYSDSTGLYHTTDGREILFWGGKFPVLLQPTWKNNPIHLNPSGEKNETYGQPYIKAKMLADTIKVKSKGGKSIIIWILLAAAALFGINYLMGGNMF